MLNSLELVSGPMNTGPPEASISVMPGGVSNAILWLAPNCDVSYDGTNQVDSWSDISAGGFVASNTGISTLSGSMPDFVAGSFVESEINSNPTFNFNSSISFNEVGNDDYLGFENFSTLVDASGITALLVANFPATSSSDQTIFSYLSSDSHNDEFDAGISDDGGMDGVFTESADSNSGLNGDLRDGITRIISIRFDGNGSTIAINGGNPGGNTFSPVSIAANGTFVIGQDLDDFSTPAFEANRSLTAEIGDLIIFDQIVGATDRQKVNSYLALKYGITLDQGSQQDYLNSSGVAIFPVVTESANYATYDNDISGIGRDDVSGLNQLRSKSVNADALLTGSSESFDSDLQFIIWGNDDGLLAFSSTEVSGGISTRIGREWRVAVSNSAGSVDLSFDLSGVTNSPAGSDNVALVVDGDGDFSNGFLRSISASTWNGTIATFDNISINDDEVLTIATMPSAPGGVSSGIGVWLSANDEVYNEGATLASDGQSVERWGDQSGNGNDALNLSIPQQPTFRTNSINFNSAVDFDGTDDDLSGSNGFRTVDYLTVFRPNQDFTSSSPPTYILGFGGFDFNGLFLGNLIGSNNVVTHFATLFGRSVDDAGLTVSNETLINSRNNALGTGQNLLLNENQLDNFSSGTFTNLSGNYILGNSPAETGAFPGLIGEVISYDVRLNDTDRLKVSSYLAIKYGLFLEGVATDYLASDGDFVYEKIVGGEIDNNHDIAAIGRDDITNLDQRKSKSANADSRLTIALTDNGGSFQNPNSFTKNLSFLAWGNDNDDNGIVEDVASDLPSNVVSRLDRQWRVQERGTVGEVTIQVDLAGIDPLGAESDFTTNTASDFLLLINSGATFNSGLTKSLEATSFDAANEIVTFQADFNDSEFFTVATSKINTFGPGGVSANLRLWLKAGAGIDETDGQLVDQWEDQSGNGSHAIQASGGMQGVYLDDSNSQAINFHPAIEFDNDLDSYTISSDLSIGAMGDVTAYYVARADLETGNDILLAFGSGANAQLHNLRVVGLPTLSYLRLSGNQMVGATTLDIGQVLLAGYQRLSANSFQLKLNGSIDATGGIGDGTFFANSSTTLGALDNTGNSGFAGELAEVIVYGDNHNAITAEAVESYLALKYGITLNGGDYDYTSPEGSIFYPGNSDTNFAGYRSDVAGICRDDKSNWKQLTAASSNTTASLRITKDDQFTGNDQYITWAHNGNAIASVGSDFPSGIESRLGRVWKLKKTNAPTGTVTMTFDLVSNYQGADLRILVDNDGDFSDATVLNTGASTNGDEFTFSSIDLSSFNDGDLFSIGTVDRTSSPLPLTWLAFSVRLSEGKVMLEWKTTNEVNVKNFEIERSTNGVDFSSIGKTNAFNLSSQINSYRYVDPQPLFNVGFYRIKQVDYDGEFTYSAIKTVNFDLPSLSVSIYPIPVSEVLQIKLSKNVNFGRFSLFDLGGKDRSLIVDGTADNTDVISLRNLNALKDGIYLLVLFLDGELIQRKVVIQN